MEYTIDATGKSLGRVASEASKLLMGKNDPKYMRHIAPDVLVKVTNASKLSLSTKKKDQKIYTRYTGYPGGLRKRTLDEMIEKKGYTEVVRKAVFGMLPSNKLRPKMIKRLEISE